MNMALNPDKTVKASRFMTYHTPLKTQKDYINALLGIDKAVKDIKQKTGLDVFAYSVFYVFFEQYMFIQSVAVMNTLLGGAAIFLLCLILIRNIWTSLLIVCTIGMIIIDLAGVMAIWHVPLNGISVVNMVMAIGISVEFCVHIAVAFMRTPGSKDERVAAALVNVGSSIVSGIFLTKFAGVSVLAFASSKLFEVFYFRMYMSICLLGSFHGLCFLPVLLSLIGPGENASLLSTCSGKDPSSSSDEDVESPHVISSGARLRDPLSPSPAAHSYYKPISEGR
eukprot:TRINITY_DN5563_c0_g1_i1.p1 TRINITY_DN5563_c0_g1~~TRINITY_DN5563_c0_g1_i1.p1  ORF type:complete len:281 (+),score=94.60 TRINITY_DN5563_c0_g1_i1:421-1263(+)